MGEEGLTKITAMGDFKFRNLYLVSRIAEPKPKNIDPIRSVDIADSMAYHLATNIIDDSDVALKAQANQEKRLVFELLS